MLKSRVETINKLLRGYVATKATLIVREAMFDMQLDHRFDALPCLAIISSRRDEIEIQTMGYPRPRLGIEVEQTSNRLCR